MKGSVLITGADGFVGRSLKGGKHFRGDITNRFDFNLRGVKGIVHLAAKASPRRCEADPEGCLRSNLFGLLNVLQLALEHKIWVLFISSFQVRERNLYGLSKLMGEELCRIYKRRGLKVRIIRLPIIFGPNDPATAKYVNRILRGENPKLRGKRRFHMLFIRDAMRFIEGEVDILERGVFGKKVTLTEFKTAVEACLNSK